MAAKSCHKIGQTVPVRGEGQSRFGTRIDDTYTRSVMGTGNIHYKMIKFKSHCNMTKYEINSDHNRMTVITVLVNVWHLYNQETSDYVCSLLHLWLK